MRVVRLSDLDVRHPGGRSSIQRNELRRGCSCRRMMVGIHRGGTGRGSNGRSRRRLDAGSSLVSGTVSTTAGTIVASDAATPLIVVVMLGVVRRLGLTGTGLWVRVRVVATSTVGRMMLGHMMVVVRLLLVQRRRRNTVW